MFVTYIRVFWSNYRIPGRWKVCSIHNTNQILKVIIRFLNECLLLTPARSWGRDRARQEIRDKCQAFGNQVANSEIYFGLTGYSLAVPLFTLKAWTRIYYTQFSQKHWMRVKKPPLPGSRSLNRPWSSVSPASNLALLLSCLWRVPVRLLLTLLRPISQPFHFLTRSPPSCQVDWLQVLNGQIVPGKSGVWGRCSPLFQSKS